MGVVNRSNCACLLLLFPVVDPVQIVQTKTGLRGEIFKILGLCKTKDRLGLSLLEVVIASCSQTLPADPGLHHTLPS